MNPALAALLVGATCIALSPIFVRVSEAGPTATAFWRVQVLGGLVVLVGIYLARRGSSAGQ